MRAPPRPVRQPHAPCRTRPHLALAGGKQGADGLIRKGPSRLPLVAVGISDGLLRQVGAPQHAQHHLQHRGGGRGSGRP